MDALDGLIIITLAINIILGVKFGVVRRAVAFAGLFLGVGAATLFVVGAVLLFEFLGAVYARLLQMLVAPLFDAAAGGFAGAALGVIEVSLGLFLGINLLKSNLPSGYAYPPSFVRAQELIMGSWFAPHFYALFPMTKLIFSAVLPSSIGGYFTQLLQGS
jgi:hypothetical protein